MQAIKELLVFGDYGDQYYVIMRINNLRNHHFCELEDARDQSIQGIRRFCGSVDSVDK